MASSSPIDPAALVIRPATIADLAVVHDLASRSAGALLVGTFLNEQELQAVEQARIFAVEESLVRAGTYYLAELNGAVVAVSGWSRGGPMMPGAGAQAVGSGTAVMRASYVDPAWSRRGLGTLLARTTETSARLAGYRRFEALCTPLSAAMRLALGYAKVAEERVELVAGIWVPGIRMRKDLSSDAAG